jgi:Raf kinase inhibitor-like YbhB/YbcL family protein
MRNGFSPAGVVFISLLLNFFDTEATEMGTVKITSPAFKQKEYLPSKYTCDGMDVNPPLTIENIPPGAKSLALIVDDPDAPRVTWVHWVVWNVDPGTREIKERSIPSGATQGMNDFGNRDYGGPCPPSGTHRYFFKLYALDTALTLGPDTTKAALEVAMKGHILAESELIGLYKRK